MFDYIKIEGFRSFKSVELEMPRLAVLIGPNGGGKSNFVDLLMLMAEAGNGALAVGINKRGGFRSIAFGFETSSDVRAELRFPGLHRHVCVEPGPALTQTAVSAPYDVRFTLGLRGLGAGGVNFIVSEEKLRLELPDGGARPRSLGSVERDLTGTTFAWSSGPDAEIVERKSVSGVELAISQVRDADKYPAPWAILQQFQGMAFYRDVDVGPESPVRQPQLIRGEMRLLPSGSNLASVLYSVQQYHPEIWEEILELLNTAYPRFVKLTVPPGGGDGKVSLGWFERPYGSQGMISANLLSDGTLKLLCLIAILKSPDPPSLICIDEPELGLHPDWIKLVAELLQDAACRTQVIVATHSPHIVSKLDADQVIVVDKVDGETKMKRLEKADLENWLKDFSLSELWLAGHFGGRP